MKKTSLKNIGNPKISCTSDVSWKGTGWDQHQNFGGIIVYSLGDLAPEIKIRIKPGYVFIKHVSKDIQKSGDEGVIHGAVTRESWFENETFGIIFSIRSFFEESLRDTERS